MNEEEIRNRIILCEKREYEYLEVGRTKIANKYSNEKYKWLELLDKVNPKRDEELRCYKIGYNKLQQRIDKAIGYIDNHNKLENELGGTIKFNIVKLLSILKGEENE